MAMKKKAAAPEAAGESAPMWIVSFADLVTLMMSFFVVLYALKQGGEKQQLEVAAAIKAQFDPSYAADSDSAFDQAIRRQRGNPGPPHQNNGGYAPKPTAGAEGLDQTVTAIRPGTQIVTGTKITFDFMGTGLDEASRKAIAEIAKTMEGLNNVVFIKGHVSGDEVKQLPANDPYGMILSQQRAAAVAEELVKDGVKRNVLRTLACGPYEPVKTGIYDAASLRQNRRVEVYSTDTTASEFAPIPTVPAAGLGGGEKAGATEQKKQVASGEESKGGH
jgi:chemotaxis protein MotB